MKAWQQLTFKVEVIDWWHNPTPYFVSFFSLSVGGKEIDEPGDWTVNPQRVAG
jgi:P pilus assembly chaperone PapD